MPDTSPFFTKAGRLKKHLAADCAVLTGDIVDFTALTSSNGLSPAQVSNHLAAAGATLRTLYPDAFPHGIHLHRGDAWQLLLTKPSLAFRCSLLIHAYLLMQPTRNNEQIRTRISIGRGSADFVPAPPKTLGQANGDAFLLSGRQLDTMGKRTLAYTDRTKETKLKDALCTLADTIARGWTTAQAQAAWRTLSDDTKTQASIASEWKPRKISQPSVAQHIKAAGLPALRSATHALEAHQ
jgi:hypothetical protein